MMNGAKTNDNEFACEYTAAAAAAVVVVGSMGVVVVVRCSVFFQWMEFQLSTLIFEDKGLSPTNKILHIFFCGGGNHIVINDSIPFLDQR